MRPGEALGRVRPGAVRERCDADGDPWGAAIASLLEGLGLLAATEADALADAALADAVRRFHSLDAPVLEALAASARSLARAQAKSPTLGPWPKRPNTWAARCRAPARASPAQALAIASRRSPRRRSPPPSDRARPRVWLRPRHDAA